MREHGDVDDTARGDRWTDFAQDGWRISILEYAEVDHLSLPRRLYLSHTDLQVRIAMKQWETR